MATFNYQAFKTYENVRYSELWVMKMGILARGKQMIALNCDALTINLVAIAVLLLLSFRYVHFSMIKSRKHNAI